MSNTAPVRATQDIYAASGVLAYRKGDIVHPDAVTALGAQDKVAGEKTKVVTEATRSRLTEG